LRKKDCVSVGETLRGLPLRFKAGTHIGAPLRLLNDYDLITTTLFFRRNTIGNSGGGEITIHLCECTRIKQER
jgi:hypothetical protein